VTLICQWRLWLHFAAELAQQDSVQRLQLVQAVTATALTAAATWAVERLQLHLQLLQHHRPMTQTLSCGMFCTVTRQCKLQLLQQQQQRRTRNSASVRRRGAQLEMLCMILTLQLMLRLLLLR
jgi:DNA-binding FadR family transcriptional regulator